MSDSYLAAVISFIAYRTATVTGSTSTAIATGGVRDLPHSPLLRGKTLTQAFFNLSIAIANTAGIVAPFLFPSRNGPRYLMGNWTCFALMGLAGVCVCFLWYKLGSSSEYQ